MPRLRWEMTDFLLWCTNSMGFSMVRICEVRWLFIQSMSAAEVVDFPEPVMPVTKRSPRWRSASLTMVSEGT